MNLIFATEQGVISVDTVVYGRTDNETCSEDRPPQQLTNTECSKTGALGILANRCLPMWSRYRYRYCNQTTLCQ